MPVTLVSKPLIDIREGYSIVSSTISIGGREFEIYYKVSGTPVLQTSDTFLAASLLAAMKADTPLKIEGHVSPKLLNTTNTIQDIIHAWYPDFKTIPVKADPRNFTESGMHRGVGSFFSGGIDSFYTLLKHKDEITTIIHVHGFDIQLEDYKFRDKVTRIIRKVASEFGKELIEVETNFRDFSDHFASYALIAHGAALASVALLLSHRLKKIYIPSSYPYDVLFPLGSHPLLDPLWSTEDVEIVHDGCETTRVKKTAQIAQFDIALKTLRICNVRTEDIYNCGQCEKCLRSMADLRAVGALDRCTTFDRELDLQALSELTLSNYEIYSRYKATLQFVEEKGNDFALAQSLRDCLAKYENNKLAEELNKVFHSFLSSSDWKRLYANRRNTILKFLWEIDSNWLTKEILRENLKACEQKLFKGKLHRLYNVLSGYLFRGDRK